MILAIDPGPEKSGYYLGNPLHELEPVQKHGHIPNFDLRNLIERDILHITQHVVIEDFEPWATKTGRNVVETCKWIGRFTELCLAKFGRLPVLLRRCDVCRFLVGEAHASKQQIRAFCVDRWGPGERQAVGTKKAGIGPLYGLRVHEFDALALALAYAEGIIDGG